MYEIAKKYHSYGLSVLPIGEEKKPLGAWKIHQSQLIEPNVNYFTSPNLKGIGFVCGKVSGNLELIDIDSKYDLTGNLFRDYKREINKVNPGLLQKLVVESTPNGGYHFFYKCSVLEGNKQLAKRETTEQEKKENEKDKVRVLIETRGEGGYVQVYPSPGCKMIFGDFSNIQEISPGERETLFDCARALNQYFEPATVKRESQKVISSNENPFEAFNENGDIESIIESEGWKITGSRGGQKTYFLRPGGTGDKSAEWDSDKRLFYVFTTSSVFEGGKAYNASSVLAKLKFNDDFKQTVKWLVENGYGEFSQNNAPQATQAPKTDYLTPKVKIKADGTDFSFLASNDEADSYIEKKRNGTFVQGATTGIPEFDKYWRFKDGEFDLWLGHDNVGKSLWSWYMACLDALFNNKKYVIFSGENRVGAVKAKLMEFYLCRKIENMDEFEFKKSKDWVEEMFRFIKTDESYTYLDIINMGYSMKTVWDKFKMIAEPYNVLEKETTNEHQFDYKAILAFRMFVRKTGVGLNINIHAQTEALRKTYPKEHEWFGYVQPPNKADAEGGGKWPNKADNFGTVHRMTNHPTEWMWTEIHIQKIKEMETGGQMTFKNEPFKVRLSQGGVGFETFSGYNAVLEYWKARQLNSTALRPSPTFDTESPAPISTPRVKKEDFDHTEPF